MRIPRTHDLEVLLDLVLPFYPLWEGYRERMIDLTVYAVAFRYPGESATRELTGDALRHATALRRQIRHDLGLPE
jgi:hypothetical protein